MRHRFTLGTLALAALVIGTGGYNLAARQVTPTLVKDINLAAMSALGSTVKPVAMNGVAYFVANDEVSDDELWPSDGTAAGAVVPKRIKPGNAPP